MTARMQSPNAPAERRAHLLLQIDGLADIGIRARGLARSATDAADADYYLASLLNELSRLDEAIRRVRRTVYDVWTSSATQPHFP